MIGKRDKFWGGFEKQTALKLRWRRHKQMITLTPVQSCLYVCLLTRVSEIITAGHWDIGCQQIHWVCWHQHITNSEILSHAGVGPVAEQIARRRTAAFGHIAWLADNVPARLALCCQIGASLGRRPSKNLKRCPGRPRNMDLVRQNSNCSPADLRRRAVFCGHGARVTLRTSLAMQTWFCLPSRALCGSPVAFCLPKAPASRTHV